MYSCNCNIPNNSNQMYRNDNNYMTYDNYSYQIQNGGYPYTTSEDERFFLAPFLFGGLAGTALGYGIANNNQINNGGCCGYYQPIMNPVYPVPYPINTSNNYYY